MSNGWDLALVAVSVRRPVGAVLVWVLGLVSTVPMVLALEISTSTDSVLERGGPEWAFYQESIRRFGGDEVLVVAVPATAGSGGRLHADIVELSRKLAEIPGVRRVDSLSTVPLVQAVDGAVLIEPLLSDSPESGGEFSEALRLAKQDEIAANSLIGAESDVAAINVQLESNPPDGFDAVVEQVRAVAGPELWISGVPVFRAEINRTAGAEVAKFVVITVLVVAAVLFALLRSPIAIAAALACGGVGTWFTLASLGAAGAPLTLVTVVLPSLMLALGVAYSMHVVAAARRAEDGLVAALRTVVPSVVFSGLTTAIGFAAVAAVRIEAIQQVGLFGAIGVVVVTAAALTLTPALLSIARVGASEVGPDRFFRESLPRSCARFADERRSLVLVVAGLAAVVSASGLASLTIETDATRWFPSSSKVRSDYENIREGLSGISPVNIVLAGEDSLVEPATMEAILLLESHLEGQADVGKALSIATPIRQLAEAFGAGARLPASADALEQYLLLLSSAEYTDDLLAPDRKSANVPLRVDHNGSAHLLATAREAEQWWSENGPAGVRAKATGIMFEFARAQEEIAAGQIRGFLLALAAISALMLARYRSIRIVFVALVPNVLPLVCAFGFLGLASFPMDAGIVVSGCLALGIAVDDTVHLLDAVRRRSSGRPSVDDLHRALREVLQPVAVTSAVVGIGFATLGFAGFTFVRNLGLLVVAVTAICLVADLLLLPALLVARSSGKTGLRQQAP